MYVFAEMFGKIVAPAVRLVVEPVDQAGFLRPGFDGLGRCLGKYCAPAGPGRFEDEHGGGDKGLSVEAEMVAMGGMSLADAVLPVSECIARDIYDTERVVQPVREVGEDRRCVDRYFAGCARFIVLEGEFLRLHPVGIVDELQNCANFGIGCESVALEDARRFGNRVEYEF